MFVSCSVRSQRGPKVALLASGWEQEEGAEEGRSLAGAEAGGRWRSSLGRAPLAPPQGKRWTQGAGAEPGQGRGGCAEATYTCDPQPLASGLAAAGQGQDPR